MSSPRIVLYLGLLIASLAICVARGPARGLHSYDFAAPYIGSERLVHGHDPYPSNGFAQEFAARGANLQATPVDSYGKHIVYPPTTLLLVAPLTLLRWYPALQVLVWGELFLYCLLMYQLSREFHADQNGRAIGFLCTALLIAGLHTCLFTGNISLLALLACSFGILLSERCRPIAGGVLLAVGLGLKPTVGITILLYLLAARRWRTLAACAAAFTAIGAASLLATLRTGPAWFANYKANVAFLFKPDGVASYLPANTWSFELLNLQFPMYELTHSRWAANVLAYAITAALCALWWAAYRRAGAQPWPLAFAPVAILSLLPFYQRNYNAALILWVFLALLLARKRPGWLEAVMAAPFFVPYQVFIADVVNRHLPRTLVKSLAFSILVPPMETWLVIAFSLLLTYRLWRGGNTQPGSDPGHGYAVAGVAKIGA